MPLRENPVPLDPQAARLIELVNAEQPAQAGNRTILQARESMGMYRRLAGPGETVMSVQNYYIHGPTADLHTRVYKPTATAASPALVYFHGGGWVVGNIDIADSAVRALANRTGCAIVSVNYQKAPEHKFPGPLNDCYVALQWTAKHADSLGINPTQVGVMGDSSGGNLAAGACIKTRDEGGAAIACQILIYPPVDPDLDKPSYRRNSAGLLLEREDMRWYWNAYLATSLDRENPLAAPLCLADFRGLPPAFVATAEYDPLLDDGRMYYERLIAAGVPAHYSCYEGMVHGFFAVPDCVSAAYKLYDEIADYIKECFNGAVAINDS